MITRTSNREGGQVSGLVRVQAAPGRVSSGKAHPVHEIGLEEQEGCRVRGGAVLPFALSPGRAASRAAAVRPGMWRPSRGAAAPRRLRCSSGIATPAISV